MNIYIVFGYFKHEDSRVEGVFNSRYKANKKEKELKEQRSKEITLCHGYYYTEKHELQ